MKTKKKRLASFLLTAAMVVGMLPVGALAAEGSLGTGTDKGYKETKVDINNGVITAAAEAFTEADSGTITPAYKNKNYFLFVDEGILGAGEGGLGFADVAEFAATHYADMEGFYSGDFDAYVSSGALIGLKAGAVLAFGKATMDRTMTGSVDYAISYYKVNDAFAFVKTTASDAALKGTFTASYYFCNGRAKVDGVGKSGLSIVNGTYVPPVAAQDVAITQPAAGTYAADMTFPTIEVKGKTNGKALTPDTDYTVAWEAGTGGTIVEEKPTTVGEYTATVTIKNTESYNALSGDAAKVTYTINKVTLNELALGNMPTAPTVGGSIAATNATATNATLSAESWGKSGNWAVGDTPVLELTFQPAENHQFKASGWVAGNIKNAPSGATVAVTAQSANSLTVTLTWPTLKAAEVPAATDIAAVQDKTGTGGVKVSFKEPATNTAIEKYIVTLTSGDDTPITEDVTKSTGGASHEVTFDLTEVDAGKKYTAKVTAVAANQTTHSDKDSATAEVTVNKATVTIEVGAPIVVTKGYTTAPKTTVKITNTGDVVAKGITLPALNGSFENQASGTNWATPIATLAPGASVTYSIQLKTGLSASTAPNHYDWTITATGTNLNKVESKTVQAKVENPGEIASVSLNVPAQPVIGGDVGTTATVTTETGMGTITNATWTGGTGTWADTNVPKVTLTLTAPVGKVYATGLVPTTNVNGVTAAVTDGAGTAVVQVTVTYKTLAAVPVSVTVSAPDALTYGYNTGNTITVAVKNDGTESAKVTMSAIEGSDFEAVNWPAGEQTIAKGATLNYTVRLKTGKTAATYKMSYTVTAGTGSKVTDGGTGKVSQVVNVAAPTLSVSSASVTGKAEAVIKVYAEPKANGKLIEDVQSNLTATVTGSTVIASAIVGVFEPGKGYPITITLKDFAPATTTAETVTVAMSAVGTKYSAPSNQTITVTPTDKTTVSFDLSKTEADFNGADQSVTFTGIKDSGTNASITLVEGTDYDIHYNGAATKPVDADAYTVTMMLKGDAASTYTPAVERTFTINKVAPVASLTTTAVSAAGKTLGDYFSGVAATTGTSKALTGAENQFKVIAGDESATDMTGTFAITSGEAFDTEVVQGASYSWSFTPDSGAATNYKTISGTVTPWANAAPSGGGGGGVSKYTVTYDAGEHGKLNGAATESVERNQFPTSVPSVTAEQGWRFLGWTLKGKKNIVNPAETKITSSTTFVAKYEEFNLSFNKELTGPYMVGNENGEFEPDREITRGEVAVLLSRLLNVKMDASKTYSTAFADVDGTEWYAKEAAFLKELGIISGVGDDSFAGERMITREEFVVMIMRIDGLIEGTNPFPDVSESSWAVQHVIAAATKGYINGMEDGTFQPTQNITRASAIKIINGVLGLKSITGEMKFNDVAADHWAYAEILNATIGRPVLVDDNI